MAKKNKTVHQKLVFYTFYSIFCQFGCTDSLRLTNTGWSDEIKISKMGTVSSILEIYVNNFGSALSSAE